MSASIYKAQELNEDVPADADQVQGDPAEILSRCAFVDSPYARPSGLNNIKYSKKVMVTTRDAYVDYQPDDLEGRTNLKTLASFPNSNPNTELLESTSGGDMKPIPTMEEQMERRSDVGTTAKVGNAVGTAPNSTD